MEIIATLGSHADYLKLCEKLIRSGVTILRLNGSHHAVKDIELKINTIKTSFPKIKLLVDLPGNKIRTTNIINPISFGKNDVLELYAHQLNYPEILPSISKNDIIYANDSLYKFKVLESTKKLLRLKAYYPGKLENNKGLHLRNINKKLPFLLTKDKEILQVLLKYKINYIGFSYVRHREDVKEALSFVSKVKKTEPIFKIETKLACVNLTSILPLCKNILIDRGDLSSEVGIEHLPHFQELIINQAKYYKCNIFLATQFISSMVNNPIPLIPEVNDIYNAIKSGAHGIQLSEETAIGNYPLDCIKIIKNIARTFCCEGFKNEQ